MDLTKLYKMASDFASIRATIAFRNSTVGLVDMTYNDRQGLPMALLILVLKP